MTKTLIDIIRHGEPLGGRKYRGNGCDDPLSEDGWRQMRAAVGDARPWSQLISSPMTRCREFALELSERLELPLRIESELREIGMGCWEGLVPAEVRERYPDQYTAYYADPLNGRPGGGEPLLPFQARIAAAFNQLANAHVGEHVLVVAHAGVMRALLGLVLAAEPRQWFRAEVSYAGLMRVQRQQDYDRLMFFNRRHID